MRHRKTKLSLFSAIVVMALAGGIGPMAKADPADQPVNPAASPAAQRLLAYLASPHPIISGQMLGGFDGYEALATSPYRGITYGYQTYVAGLAAAAGKWPGLVGVNFAKNRECLDKNPYVPSQPSPFMDCANPRLDYRSAYQAADQILINYWNAGGLVTVMWQVSNPWTGQSAKDTNIPGNFADLYTPGTPMNQTFDHMLDELAAPLAELQQAGVVVLFRPYHEQNGNWFWWGYKGPDGQPSADQFSALWRYTFQYLTNTKGLNNLLWVYCVNRNGGPTDKSDVLVFDPGANYFDIAAVDDYKATPSDKPQNMRVAYEQITSLGKPFALAEYGPLGHFIDDPSHHFDWMDLVNVDKTYPGFAYFMAWDGTPTERQSLTQNEDGAALLNMPGVVTNRDGLNWK
jgi:mannan endo-1,4-beta-mannosidase